MVGSRWGRIMVVLVASFLVVDIMVDVRRGLDSDVEDWIWSALVLSIAFWLFAQCLGLLVRRSVAGHALRLDAAGLHFPGWDTVPWTAIRALKVETKETDGAKSKRHLFSIEIDPSCRAHKRGSYERWMFGPVEGLVGNAVKIGIASMAVDPVELRKAVQAWQPHLAPRRPA